MLLYKYGIDIFYALSDTAKLCGSCHDDWQV